MEARVNQILVPLSVYEGWECLTLEQRDKQVRAYFRYGFYKEEPTDLNGLEKALYLNNPPIIESYLANYEKKGGKVKKVGAPYGNNNAGKAKTTQNNSNQLENNSETINSIQNNSENNSNQENNSHCKDKEMDKEKINKGKEEEEEEDSKQVASSSSSSAFKEDFSPIDFIQKWWNSICEDYPHLKKCEFISKSLQQKINEGYAFALDTCDNDVNRAKNMLAKAVVSMAKSEFFEKNQGKATLTWLFANTDNLEKCANGNFNDY